MILPLNNVAELLEESLTHPPIAQTKNFTWLVTPVGIAALCKESKLSKTPPFDDAIKEGIEVALDLRREEKEFHQTKKGLLILFYS